MRRAASDELLGYVSTAVGLAVGFVALVETARHPLPQWTIAAGFCVLVAFGELLRVNLPGEREASPVAGAAAIGYAVLTAAPNGERAQHSAGNVVAVVLVGTMAAAAIHVLLQRDPRLPDLARRVVTTTVIAVLFRDVLVHSLPEPTVGRHSNAPIVAMALAVLAGLTVDVLLLATMRAARQRSPLAPALRNEFTAQAGIGTAMAATGLLIALALPVMGLWALLGFCTPLLATQFSFRRFASISATYRQTIRALSRVTEVGGYVQTGHGRRVMNLSVAVGREFGLTESELLDLEYAALMHDIGQLSLADPIPRGSTIIVTPSERRRIAEMGAAVIRTTGTMDRVATIVAAQASPYRKMRMSADVQVPLASRIVKAVSAYDDLLGAASDAPPERRAWDALERLRMGMAFEYDPRVVEALTRVLQKSGQL